ncbi:MAG: hypothetical protein ACOYD4_04120 [Solirubrobacterales bacterium]
MRATVDIETITPREAVNLLANKLEEQRNIRNRHVERLAADMLKNRFRLGPDAILLIKGKLANGQHRMSAVVLSKMPQKFLVLRCDDEELFKYIDCGAQRSAGDVIRNCGNQIAAIAGKILQLQAGKMRVGSNDVASRSEVIEFAMNNREEIHECLLYCAPFYRGQPLFPISVSAAFLYLAKPSGRLEEAKQLVQAAYTGEGPLRDYAKSMRDQLVRQAISKYKSGPNHKMALLIKSWRGYVSKACVQVAKINEGEAFPTMP